MVAVGQRTVWDSGLRQKDARTSVDWWELSNVTSLNAVWSYFEHLRREVDWLIGSVVQVFNDAPFWFFDIDGMSKLEGERGAEIRTSNYQTMRRWLYLGTANGYKASLSVKPLTFPFLVIEQSQLISTPSVTDATKQGENCYSGTRPFFALRTQHISLCTGLSTGFHSIDHHQNAAATTKHIQPPPLLLRNLWRPAAHHLIHTRRLAHHALYLDHHPFIQSFSLPVHRICAAVSAETVCPPREPANGRRARCTASREREPMLCAGGKEDVKQEKTKRGDQDGKDKGDGVRARAGSSSASSHYETSKLEIRSC